MTDSHSEEPAAPTPAEADRRTAAPGRHGEILVVDDMATTRLLLSGQLRGFGHHVTMATDGQEALRLLECRAFDLVLLDVRMPGMDGVAVLERLKADPALRDIPVIVISAVDEFESVLRCIERGAEDYLHKPFDPVLLMARVRASLERKRLWDELKEKHRQLEELRRLQESLTQMMVHDLRTPLTSLLTGLMTVEALGGLDEDQQEILGTALAGGRRVVAMVTDLLDISKMEHGSLSPALHEGVDATGLIEDALAQVAALLNDKGLSLLSDVRAGVPPLRVDPGLLVRVLVNLLGNAVKFTPPGATVTVSVAPDEAPGGVVFAVADEGEGIPEQAFERIFEKFGQVDTRRGGRGMSTGLGLTFCRMVVEAHGGRIWVESELGAGSTFRFVVPAAA